MDHGYDRTYQLVLPRLQECDLEEAAQRAGFPPPVKGVLEVEFLKRKYGVRKNGVEVIEDISEDAPEETKGSAQGQSSRSVEKSLLVYYLTSAGQGEPRKEYLFAHQFIPGKGMWGKGGGLSWQIDPLEKAYEGKLAEFKKAMEWLGAVPEPEKKDGQHIWIYRIFPKISVWICYYDADEEFPCMIQIKFDSGASRYLDFEPLAFLQGSLVNRLLEYLGS